MALLTLQQRLIPFLKFFPISISYCYSYRLKKSTKSFYLFFITPSCIDELNRLLPPSNADLPIFTQLSGIVKPVQLQNAYSLIPVTLSGIVMLVRLLQPRNTNLPIFVTPSGIVMLVRLLQPSNALSPISVTLFGIVMLVRPLQL